MRIQHNIMAMNAYRNYTNNVSAMKKNLERLSSGYKINRAGDDAAGLAISEKMRAQITGLETAQKNAKDGISLVQTAEGALTEVHDMLNRMVELATQSANGTYDNDTDRAALQQELEQLQDEIDRISKSTNFNGINVLSGDYATTSSSALGDGTVIKSADGANPSAAGAAVIEMLLKNANAESAKAVDAASSTDGTAATDADFASITLDFGLRDSDITDVKAVIDSDTTKNGTVGAAGSIDLSGWATADDDAVFSLKIRGEEVTFSHKDYGTVAQLTSELAKYGITLTDAGSGSNACTIAATAVTAGDLTGIWKSASTLVADTDLASLDADTLGGWYLDATATMKISDYFDITDNGDNTFTLKAKTPGNLDATSSATANAAWTAVKGITATITGATNYKTANVISSGKDVALKEAASSNTEYTLDIDWDEVVGGVELYFGTESNPTAKFKFVTDGTTSGMGSSSATGATGTDENTYYISIKQGATAAEKAQAFVAALQAHTNINSTTNNSVLTITLNDDNTISIKGNASADGSAGVTGTGNGSAVTADDIIKALAKTNLGNLRSNLQAADGSDRVVKSDGYKPVDYSPNAKASGYFATATYKLAGEWGVGSVITIGDYTVTLVDKDTPDDKLESGQVKFTGTFATDSANIINSFAAQGLDVSKIQLTELKEDSEDPNKVTGYELVIGGTKVGQTGEELELELAGKVKYLNVDSVPGASVVTLGDGTDNVITANETTLDNIKDFVVNGVRLGDYFTIKINGSTKKGDYVIQEGDQITITANRAGKLSDNMLAALTPDEDSALVSRSVTNGYDEGSTAAGDRTTYQFKLTMASLVGGNKFIIGNDENSYTFEISLDENNDKNTDNGTIAPDKEAVTPGHRSINIWGMDEETAAKEIVQAVKDTIGDTGDGNFTVEYQLVNGTLTINLTAAGDGKDYNYGNGRISSNSSSIECTVYKPAGGAANGTEGTYAQVTYGFDASLIQAGDYLTVGGVTVYFDDVTENGGFKAETDGTQTKITVDATMAKNDPQGAIVKALEAAGYTSGQIEFDAANKTVTITGIETGQTGANLAANGAKMYLGNVNDRSMVSKGLKLQIGDTADPWNQITVNIEATDSKSLGVDSQSINIETQDGALDAIDKIKSAINQVSKIRGTLGATQNRLDHTINNLSVMTENIQDAESTIRDTDIAEEMMAYTKNNILIQSAQAMLAQANQVPQGVLQLLQ